MGEWRAGRADAARDLGRRAASTGAVPGEVVAFHDVRTRLADFLAAAASGDTGHRIVATHDMIAAELGTSRETVSRLLKEYERRGVVELGRGRVRVVDPARLREPDRAV